MASETIKCSRCGARRGLRLVTLRYSEREKAGRLLLYCDGCREQMFHLIGVELPIEDVTDQTFLDLYRAGLTGSEPEMASAIVFGERRTDTVCQATAILKNGDAGSEET